MQPGEPEKGQQNDVYEDDGLASSDGEYKPYEFGGTDKSSYSIELVYYLSNRRNETA